MFLLTFSVFTLKVNLPVQANECNVVFVAPLHAHVVSVNYEPVHCEDVLLLDNCLHFKGVHMAEVDDELPFIELLSKEVVCRSLQPIDMFTFV